MVIPRAGLKRRLHGFALVVIHPAVDQCQAVAAEAVSREDLVHPLLSCPVFGEEYDPLVRPLAVDLEMRGEPLQYGMSFGILSARCLLSPRSQTLKHQPLLFVGRPNVLAGFADRLVFRQFALRVVGVVFLRLRDGSPEDALIQLSLALLGRGAPLDGRYVPFQCRCEGCG